VQPDADSCQFAMAKAIGREFVVAGGDTPTLLDRVEELPDELRRTIQVRAKANLPSCKSRLTPFFISILY
jgi:hypothetical protein